MTWHGSTYCGDSFRPINDQHLRQRHYAANLNNRVNSCVHNFWQSDMEFFADDVGKAKTEFSMRISKFMFGSEPIGPQYELVICNQIPPRPVKGSQRPLVKVEAEFSC